mmetsp:Transcript_60638/g.157675  ORF Transcript_60638/g.157675 Transcript_60638/m.157675 type:complete len:219 (+) Transcript_60638:1508-2164(+)
MEAIHLGFLLRPPYPLLLLQLMLLSSAFSLMLPFGVTYLTQKLEVDFCGGRLADEEHPLQSGIRTPTMHLQSTNADHNDICGSTPHSQRGHRKYACVGVSLTWSFYDVRTKAFRVHIKNSGQLGAIWHLKGQGAVPFTGLRFPIWVEDKLHVGHASSTKGRRGDARALRALFQQLTEVGYYPLNFTNLSILKQRQAAFKYLSPILPCSGAAGVCDLLG